MDEGESIRFVIEGMDGQCIVALDKRLLVVKPGSAIDEPHSGLTTSIPYSDITKIKVTEGPSNRVIKIHTPDYQPTEVTAGQGLLESNAFSLSTTPPAYP